MPRGLCQDEAAVDPLFHEIGAHGIGLRRRMKAEPAGHQEPHRRPIVGPSDRRIQTMAQDRARPTVSPDGGTEDDDIVATPLHSPLRPAAPMSRLIATAHRNVA
ncbi:MAG: hypothetical protein R3322_04105 [Kiloniellales bacterium]|nr:hypothetical protein [Kiloniellales bacterium]